MPPTPQVADSDRNETACNTTAAVTTCLRASPSPLTQTHTYAHNTHTYMHVHFCVHPAPPPCGHPPPVLPIPPAQGPSPGVPNSRSFISLAAWILDCIACTSRQWYNPRYPSPAPSPTSCPGDRFVILTLALARPLEPGCAPGTGPGCTPRALAAVWSVLATWCGLQPAARALWSCRVALGRAASRVGTA